MKETKEEILNAQVGETLNTEEHSQIFKTTPIEGTPLSVIEQNGKHFAALGKYRCSIDYDTHEYVEKLILEKDWTLLISVIFAVISGREEYISISKNLNQNQQ